MFAPEQQPTSPLLQDPGVTSLPVLSSVSQSGTTTTGEEEQLKKFSMPMKEGDIIVTLFSLIIFIAEQLKAINRVRIGEENEVTNLIDYLTNSTVRE